jgi:hypothetical protein
MTAVKQLTATELRDFKRRFTDWQQKNGGHAEEATALVQACKLRLSAADRRNLRKLISKSERGVLSADEL